MARAKRKMKEKKYNKTNYDSDDSVSSDDEALVSQNIVGQLYNNKYISSFWTYNGSIKIKIDEETYILGHEEDIPQLFPDLDLDFFV